MLPQTQIAGHLVIERATLPPPPYGGKIKSKTLCQATVLATQIWLKLDSENLNRSLLCTFGWSETQILSGRREPAGPYGSGEARVSWGGQARWQMWVYNASPCSDKASTAGGENSQIVTNEQREVTHSNVDWAVRRRSGDIDLQWQWFISGRQRNQQFWQGAGETCCETCGAAVVLSSPLSVTLGGIRVWQLPSPQDLNKCLLQGFTDRTLFRSSQ